MSDSGRETPRRLDPDDVALIEEIQALQGEEMPVDQDAVLEPDEFERPRTPTLTELDRGEVAADEGLVGNEATTVNGSSFDELREGETDDPDVAAEEGLTYVPPSDPPFHTDPADPDGFEFADEMDLTGRIHEALRADAATTDYADRLVIGTRGRTAVVRGIVDDIDDSDTIVEVVQRVDGIDDVVDQTELAGG